MHPLVCVVAVELYLRVLCNKITNNRLQAPNSPRSEMPSSRVGVLAFLCCPRETNWNILELTRSKSQTMYNRVVVQITSAPKLTRQDPKCPRRVLACWPAVLLERSQLFIYWRKYVPLNLRVAPLLIERCFGREGKTQVNVMCHGSAQEHIYMCGAISCTTFICNTVVYDVW